MRTALLLIDIQNDFLPPRGSLAVPDGDAVIPVANRLMPRYELVVATQDWHPPDHGSFASLHPGHQVGDVIDLDGLTQVLWPDHCVQNTNGAQLAAALDRKPIARIVHKGTDPTVDSYSGFFDNGHRRATELDAYLKEQGVEAVHLVGLATDYCVKFTALDAKSLGYQVTVIRSGVRGVELNPGDCKRAFDEMKQADIELS